MTNIEYKELCAEIHNKIIQLGLLQARHVAETGKRYVIGGRYDTFQTTKKDKTQTES